MKIALVWASNNPEKFWNRILKDLVNKWHTVLPINPKEETIEWIKTYKTIKDINQDFDIVNFVIKPEIVEKILENNIDILKGKTIWCQPGASNTKVEEILKENYSNYITNSCIMIEKIN